MNGSLLQTLRTRDALRITRMHGGVLVPALRVGVSYAVPILALLASGLLELAPFAALGAFTSLYCRVDTYARRARLLPVVAVGLTASVAAGAVAAAADAGGVVKVLVLAAVATLSKLLADVLRLGPPGGLMFVFAAGAAAYSPQTWDGFTAAVAAAAASAALSFLISMLGALLHPTGPHRLATARALLAVADHLKAPSAASRRRAHASVHQALTALHEREGRAVARLRGHLAHAVHLLHHPAEEADELRAVGRRLRWGSIATPVHDRTPPRPVPAERARLRAFRTNAARMVVASVVTGLIASTFQLDHAYWAVVSVSSVLQSHNTATTWQRALQRSGGTVAGGLLALGIFATDPSPVGLLLVVVICQIAAELVVMANYGLGLTFATPLALCLAALGHPADHFHLVAERVAMTLFGALLGVAICLVLTNGQARARLRRALEDCRRATQDLRSSPTDPDARNGLLRAVFALRDAHLVAAGEPLGPPHGDQEVLDTEHEAYRLLAATTGSRPVVADLAHPTPSRASSSARSDTNSGSPTSRGRGRSSTRS
ncbi:FUSC family protein [Saccharopolyspora rhizosphaerae]|uniref:FUSC family protein n=1 Tax=Saccharopolyspora rhizosphaerae TaxID=2492662 RepID=A0A3R8Q9D5_9PSEU|nr:FUSC family protein [Saccharopolyspora rhizosphaerae]RRO19885.1 FUSC family protein [Saccharopolyspora rhizosphaerae]